MIRLLARAATAVTIAGSATALAVLPANAANDSPNAPDPFTRAGFCTNTSSWYVGYTLGGASNDRRAGVWVINRIVDDPHQTRFDATFYAGDVSSVSWYCR